MSALEPWPPGVMPRRTSLDLVLATWVEARSGHFSGASGEAVPVSGGEPLTAHGLAVLTRELCDGTLRFRDGQVSTGSAGARARLGPVLLAAGRRLADPQAVQRALGAHIVAGPFAAGLVRLPLRPVTRRVLREAVDRADLTLSQGLDRARLPLVQVQDDLAALLSLGMLRVTSGASRHLGRVGGASAEDSRSALSAQERARLARRRLVARLDSDWQALEGADDHAVLGVPPDADPRLLARSASRMRARYATLDEEVTDSVRPLADQVRQRVELAIERLGAEPGEVDDSVEPPDPEHALRLGQQAVAEGRLDGARRWLGLACRQATDHPVAMAWYGWVLVVDPAVRTERATRRGLELLDRALALAPHDDGVLLRLAEAAVHLGDRARARAALAALEALPHASVDLDALRLRVARLATRPG